MCRWIPMGAARGNRDWAEIRVHLALCSERALPRRGRAPRRSPEGSPLRVVKIYEIVVRTASRVVVQERTRDARATKRPETPTASRRLKPVKCWDLGGWFVSAAMRHPHGWQPRLL